MASSHLSALGSPDHIRGGLEQLRKRLIDLSKRNKLLNFKHGLKSCLRVVDELPDELFSRLKGGASLVFRPVPEPPLEEENITQGASAQPLLSSTPSSNETSTAPRRRRMPAKEYAATLGIRTSYELPNPNEEGNPNHFDKYVQTLHYPDELESTLRRIGGNARTAIEESGTNMLYLIFGFLEWYESPDSSEALISPLLTLPVELTRNRPSRTYGGMFEFSVEHTGEDLLTNLSLVERMKRDFALSVPELEDEDTPESYFRRFSKILGEQSRWKIRRHVTLSLLQFGKLLMFLDLEASRHLSLLTNERVKELLGETTGGEERSYGDVYELDHPDVEDDLPPLIYDADSSQHSALVDALKGKNLVIEGPPGTGKSQTITNLITASLVAGKTVLFVSEKLAALEVVRRRLDQAGLGDFCLELHSHKTKKDKLLHDISQRLSRRRSFRDPSDLDDKHNLLQRAKKELIEYVHIINQPYGALRKSIFDILWSRDNCLQHTPALSALADRLSLDCTNQVTPAEKEHQRFLVEVYQQHLVTLLTRYRCIAAHPWFGVENSGLAYAQEREAVDKLQQLRFRLARLQTIAIALSNLTAIPIESTFERLQRFSEALSVIPQASGVEHFDLLLALKPIRARGPVKQFMESLRTWKRESEELGQLFTELRAINVDENELQSVLAKLQALNLGNITKRDLPVLVARVREVRSSIIRLRDLFAEVSQRLSSSLNLDWDLLPLLPCIATLLEHINFNVLHLRNASLANPSLKSVRTQALDKAQAIRRLQDQLSKTFVLSRLPSSDDLWKHASVISSSSFFSRLFNGEYKAAKHCYVSLRKDAEKVQWAVMASDLKELAEYQDQVKAFSSNRQYQEAFGQCFNGLDTPFHDVAAIELWYEDLQCRFTAYQENAQGLAEIFSALPVEDLRNLAAFVANNSSTINSISGLNVLIDGLPFCSDNSCRVNTTVSEFIDKMAHVCELMERAITCLKDVPFRDAISIEEMPGLIQRAANLLRLQAQLNNDPEMSAFLADHYKGCLTDIDALNATTHLVELVLHVDVPEEIQDWLLNIDFRNRAAILIEILQSVRSDLSQYSTLWREFCALTELDIGKWYSEVAGDWTQFKVELICSRLDRAIEASSGLSEWLEYIRGRSDLRNVSLDALISVAEEGRIESTQLKDAYEFAFFNGLSNLILKGHPKLLNFSRNRHERVREQFARLDAEIVNLNRKRAAYQIARRPVPQGVGNGPVRDYTDLALLEHEIQKQRGHIPIRRLLNRAHKALLALKPCFMMGPMSVAQYLSPGQFHFDLVVMDEASQLKPEEALGAVSRGSQVVIVGDPKQLPPTSFFDSMFMEPTSGEEEDDNLAIEESESILDRACEVYKPIRQLRWHYRSRHESLIAFSNHHFYDNNLILFPSPLKKNDNLGIKHRLVNNGIYSGGKNRPEAERVVRAILEHMSRFPNESLGVATFNSTQRDLIEELFDAEVKKDGIAQAYIAKWLDSAEPFFIKNLETVQGDERDCIFISFTYGRDENGNMYQRFGPINGPNGHRRLNVLFTRSKLRTEVFTSMRQEDVQIGEGASLGLKAMRAYLAFAETGVLEQPIHRDGPEPNEFEMSVRNALQSRGLTIQPQVGVAGYFIDLAVCHPWKDGCYILGIECDGATYHSAKSARDRDRLREGNLRNLGWDIHRVWSTDWLKNRSAEIERIIQRVHNLLRGEELRGAIHPTSVDEQPGSNHPHERRDATKSSPNSESSIGRLAKTPAVFSEVQQGSSDVDISRSRSDPPTNQGSLFATQHAGPAEPYEPFGQGLISTPAAWFELSRWGRATGHLLEMHYNFCDIVGTRLTSRMAFTEREVAFAKRTWERGIARGFNPTV